MKIAGFVLWVLFLVVSVSADPSFPVTVRDAWGADLTLVRVPKAIVSLTLTTDELLFDLVDPGRIAAIEAFAIDPGISNVAGAAKKVPQVSTDKERLLTLGADLVLVADWKEKDFVQSLRDAKVPVFVVHSPNDFPELRQAIGQLAALVGEPARGRALVARIDRRLAAVAAGWKSGADRPTVLSYSFDGSTYGRGTSFDALVDQAGLVNAATRAGLVGWPRLSQEQVLALDPDFIVLPSWSWDGRDDPQRFLARFLTDPVFAGLKAVKNRRVVVLPDRHLQSTSQYMVDGVEDLARLVQRPGPGDTKP